MSDTIEAVMAAEAKATERATNIASSFNFKGKKKKAQIEEFHAKEAKAKAQKEEEAVAQKAKAAADWKAHAKKRMEDKAKVKLWVARKAYEKDAEEEKLVKDNKAAARKEAAKWETRKSTAEVMQPFNMNTSNHTVRGKTSPEQKKENLGNLEAFCLPTEAFKRQTTVATPFTLSESNAKPKKNNVGEAQALQPEAKEVVRSAESLLLNERLQDTTMTDRATVSNGKRERKASVLASASALAAAPPTKIPRSATAVDLQDKLKGTDMRDRDIIFGAKNKRKASAAAEAAALASSSTKIPLPRSSLARTFKKKLKDTSTEDRSAASSARRERKLSAAAAAAALAASPTKKSLPLTSTALAFERKFQGTTAEDRGQARKARRALRKASVLGCMGNMHNNGTAPQTTLPSADSAEPRTRI